MKTKSLYPIITTKDFEGSLKFYTEVLDFSVKHERVDNGIKHIIMENSVGLQFELMDTNEEADDPLLNGPGLFSIRINVDYLPMAYEEFKNSGCEILQEPFEISSGKAMVVRDPNGVTYTVVEHIRK